MPLPANIEKFKGVLTEGKFNELLEKYKEKLEHLKNNPKVKSPAALAYNHTFGKYAVLLEDEVKPPKTKKKVPEPDDDSKDIDEEDDYYL